MKKTFNLSLLLVLVCTIRVDAFSLKGQKLLFILTDKPDIFGTVVRETETEIVVESAGKTVRLKQVGILRVVSPSGLEKEFEKRKKQLKNTFDGCFELGLWCKKVERYHDAAALFKKALALKPRSKVAKKELEAAKKAALKHVPWTKGERPVLRLDAQKIITGGQWGEDPEARMLLESFLQAANPPFKILPSADKKTKADYIIQVKNGAKLESENKFYGDVVVSQNWVGVSRFTILDPKTKKPLFVLKPIVERQKFSSRQSDPEATLSDRVFKRMLLQIRGHKGFRLQHPEK